MAVRIISSFVGEGNGHALLHTGNQKRSREAIHIGLVNNMPEAAFKATENQFVNLLNLASDGISVDLSMYVLRGTPMSTSARFHYASVDELWNERLDGLIVTGAEPTTAALQDERYWESFSQLVDWARDTTTSTIWSCLAAHAAVLCMDGIERRRGRNKHFGVFQCEASSEHWLLDGAQSQLSVPHSRWNSIAEEDLNAHQYKILSRTREAEVDTFIKQDGSLFVFCQGHPEYETDTLLREYRRDIGRFLRDESQAYPNLPSAYFDSATEKAFAALQARAQSLRHDQFLNEIATTMKSVHIENNWKPTAVRLYSNWLNYCYSYKGAGRPSATFSQARSLPISAERAT